jgi:hypothetical protein
MPRLPDPDFSKWGQGTSLLGGWFPISIEILTIGILIVAIGWRTRRLATGVGTGQCGHRRDCRSWCL